MNKKIVIIILITLLAVIGFFAFYKINEKKFDYELETIPGYNFFVSAENEKFGVINQDGKTIIEAAYDKVEIPNPSKDIFICYNNGKGIALDSNKQQLFAEYNSIEPVNLKNYSEVPYEKSVLITEKNGKYGLIDFSGKKILDTEFESIENFSNIEGLLQFKKNEKYGIANIKGTIIVKPSYDNITSDNYYNENDKYKKSGFIVGEKKEDGYKYGYLNYKGKQILKVEYSDISRVIEINDIENTYLINAKNGQYGVIKNKKIIIPNSYQDINYDKNNNIYILQKNKKYGTANLDGKIVIPVESTNIESKGKYLYVEKNNVRGVYNGEGNKVNIDFDKTIMETSNEKYKIVVTSNENSNYYGVLNQNDKQIINSEYLYIEYAFENYFIVCGLNGKLGVIDSDENVIIDLNYDLVQKLQGKNIIQALSSATNITEIYSEKLDKVYEMENAYVDNQADYVKVYSNTEVQYFDQKGSTISSITVFPNNKLYATSKDGLWGYVDKNGETIINYEYEMATELNKYGYGAIKKDGKWGCIDSNGNIVVEPKFEINDTSGKVEFIGEYVKVNEGFGNDYYMK